MQSIVARKNDVTDCIYAALECAETVVGKFSVKRKKFERLLTYAVAPLCSILVPLDVEEWRATLTKSVAYPKASASATSPGEREQTKVEPVSTPI